MRPLSYGVRSIPKRGGLERNHCNYRKSIWCRVYPNVNLRSSIKEADIFNKAITKISDGIHGAISAITNFGKSLKKNVGKNKDLVSFGDSFSTMIIQMISRIGDGFEAVRKSVDQLLGGRSILDILNSMIFTGSLASFTMFQHKITGGLSEIVESISKIFNKAAKGKTVTLLQQVKNCFKAYQTDLNAKALLKIAGAIAILSGSIFVLSSIDGQALARSLGGMGVMLGELLAAMAIFDKTTSNVKGAFKAQTTMLAMATAISIMAGALKKMSGIDTVTFKSQHGYDWSTFGTANTTDTWVPVMNGSKVNHRVLPTDVAATIDGGCFQKRNKIVTVNGWGVGASSIIFNLPSTWRPVKGNGVFSGFCYNISNHAFYPVTGNFDTNGVPSVYAISTWNSAYNNYAIYNSSTDRRSNFQLYVTGSWLAN